MKKLLFLLVAIAALSSFSLGQGGIASQLRNGVALPTGAPQWSFYQLTVGNFGLYQCVHSPTCTQTSHWMPASPSPPFATLTDGASVTWALSGAVSNGSVTLAGNRTLVISGAVSGATGTLVVIQDATGSRTLNLPSGSKVLNGAVGIAGLSTTPGAIDILTFIYNGTSYFWTIGKNYN